MYLKHIPAPVRHLYPHYLWRMPAREKTLYLTFDDGPHPEVTPWVLQQLAEARAQATFFLLGQQVRQHPALAHHIIDAGHMLGNHGESHLNGYHTSLKRYLRDVLQGQQTIAEYTGFQPRLFRPPYGRLTRAQGLRLRGRYQIVMMDVIAGDFDPRRSGASCLQTVVRHARPGSIVLLHDSPKAWDRLHHLLPRLLAHFQADGYTFAALPQPSRSLSLDFPDYR